MIWFYSPKREKMMIRPRTLIIIGFVTLFCENDDVVLFVFEDLNCDCETRSVDSHLLVAS